MPDKILLRRGNVADLPTLQAGEPGFALDSKKLYIGTASGNQGIVSASPVTQTWLTPTLLNSWVVNSISGQSIPARYYKDDLNIVWVYLYIRSGTTTNGTTILTLPAGYRPMYNMEPYGAVFNGTSISFGAFTLTNNGNLNIDSIAGNAWVSLNFNFRAEQ